MFDRHFSFVSLILLILFVFNKVDDGSECISSRIHKQKDEKRQLRERKEHFSVYFSLHLALYSHK